MIGAESLVFNWRFVCVPLLAQRQMESGAKTLKEQEGQWGDKCVYFLETEKVKSFC